MKIINISVLTVIAIALASCSLGPPNAVRQQERQQEQIEKQSNMAVGMPAIHNFAEKRELKQIYELRDEEIPTTTYIVDLYGNLHKLCDSVGFGIPYATEYTDPEQTVEGDANGEFTTIPQADPNGLYSPPDAEGTWVLCVNPQTKRSDPLYVEPRIIVTPFPLPSGA